MTVKEQLLKTGAEMSKFDEALLMKVNYRV